VAVSRSQTQPQTSLFGDGPEPTDRLFFALFLPADAALKAAAIADNLRERHRLRGKPLASDRLHVTLNHLGDYAGVPNDIVAAAMQAGAAVTASPFDVVFDRVTSFSSRPRNKPVILRGEEGLAPLIAFQQALALQMRKAGLGRLAEQNYVPHVTLLYDDAGVVQEAIEPVGWSVREFVLVHSLLGQTRHIVLARWLLG
jgi:2'-5' RNA ligase